ncbi:hypothetical protein JW826_00180 [Candidatus Woesearchaeota archaeon]|nr:hypothetical protein [Candidatus Woesearchaeota archaeon]
MDFVDRSEVEKLAKTLRANRLAISDLEAYRMAEDMLSTGKKVNADLRAREERMGISEKKDPQVESAHKLMEKISANLASGAGRVHINLGELDTTKPLAELVRQDEEEADLTPLEDDDAVVLENVAPEPVAKSLVISEEVAEEEPVQEAAEPVIAAEEEEPAKEATEPASTIEEEEAEPVAEAIQVSQEDEACVDEQAEAEAVVADQAEEESSVVSEEAVLETEPGMVTNVVQSAFDEDDNEGDDKDDDGSEEEKSESGAVMVSDDDKDDSGDEEEEDFSVKEL